MQSSGRGHRDPLRTGAGIRQRRGELRAAVQVVLRESTVDVPEVISQEYLREQSQKPGPLKELLRFFVSQEHFGLREILGTAAKF